MPFFSGCVFPKIFPNVLVAKHMGCMHQALACLAHLASHRPRSPCLHQQHQQRCSAPLRRLGCCCEVQARRARPMRGEVSQATPWQGETAGLGQVRPWLGPGICPGPCPAPGQAPLFGPWPFICGFPWPIIYTVLPMFPCGVVAK